MELENFISSTLKGNISFAYNLNEDRFIHVDDVLRNLFRAEELSIDTVLPAIVKEDVSYLKNSVEKLLNGSLNGNVQFRIKVEDNERWMRLTPFLIGNADEKLIVGNICDITDEINSQYSLNKFANKKNSILNILAHDLRGPLEIAGMITPTLALKTTDSYVINQSNNLSKLIKQSLDLVNDLLQREEAETINLELVKKRLNIAAKVKEYLDELRQSENALQREIIFTASSNEIYLNLDESKFMQIFNNLVSNALKFTHNGATISATVEELEDKVLFTFSDTGIGIPAEFHAELFEKFTPARRKGLNGEPTIGMGLSIVKTIIEWHDGNIRVESEEGRGTTFYFEIPKSE